ncbi:MAG: cyclic 2,3-diphosphoglycerate synthase [Fidelibacterota bacterium]
MSRTRILIMGAAGRDFHNFNTVFRDDPHVEVVAFTAAQIPNIEDRTYPPELSGDRYPEGIPIYPEQDLSHLIDRLQVDEVVFSYSDVSHEYVMHKASEVIKAGADFTLLGGIRTMIASRRPVVAVGAVRTGSGKSQTTRRVAGILRQMGKRVVVVRHPMPYGDLARQKVQRFTSLKDMEDQECTIEEMEEYEHHLVQGSVVYAGIDYQAILDQAEGEADVILWDGGNNDLPFYRPDLFIVVVDPHRPGHEVRYHPGEANLRLADVVVINKMNTAAREDVETVRHNIGRVNPGSTIIEAASPVTADNPGAIEGKRVLVVEDGPTLTHGEMTYGAGTVAARNHGAREIVDPRPWTVGSIRRTFETYPHIGHLLPAMGYGDRQIKDLEATINAVECDAVIIGTPVDLRRIMAIKKPTVRVTYELKELSKPDLEEVLRRALA